MPASDDIILEVDAVSKRFCRDLKRSLWYGIKDIAGDCLGGSTDRAELRPSEFWALRDVSFTLRRGECLGLIGSNGAGKTTLLRLISGLIKPDHGAIRRRGRLGALIALGAGFNPVLSGRENIYVNAAILGLSKKETDDRLDEIIAFADIGDALVAPVQSYSSGMTVRLGFAIAAHLEPDLLLIDEVLAVGDVAFRMKCIQRVREVLDFGAAAVFVSHDMVALQRICLSGLLLEKGRRIFDGDITSTLRRYYVTDRGNFAHLALRDAPAKVNAGEPLSFHVAVGGQKTGQLRLLVRIDSVGIGPLGGQSFTFSNTSTPAEVVVTAPCLPFHDGTYTVFAALYGEGDGDFIEQGVLFSFHLEGSARSFFARGPVGAVEVPMEFLLREVVS